MAITSTSLEQKTGTSEDSIIWELPDGASTTFYVGQYAMEEARLLLVHFERGTQLAEWCQRTGVTDALVGGFIDREQQKALGDLWVANNKIDTVPFDEPWGERRGSIHITPDNAITIDYRNELPSEVPGDLLQAGPLLVKDGKICFSKKDDFEGFSAGAHQFDSDITAERHPRAAIGISKDEIFLVTCDGRSEQDAGVTLEEMAEYMGSIGCIAAMNVDGGGSTSFVKDGELVNTPRRGFEEEIIGGREIKTALIIRPRALVQ